MTKWTDYFMGMADYVATASKDPSTKVGCVIVDPLRRVIGLGYNGFPRGVDDSDERLNHRPTKILMVMHAESNAVLNSTIAPRGCSAYVTHQPCAACSGVLIQAGITTIYTRRPDAGLAERFCDSFTAAHNMLSEAGVELIYV